MHHFSQLYLFLEAPLSEDWVCNFLPTPTRSLSDSCCGEVRNLTRCANVGGLSHFIMPMERHSLSSCGESDFEPGFNQTSPEEPVSWSRSTEKDNRCISICGRE